MYVFFPHHQFKYREIQLKETNKQKNPTLNMEKVQIRNKLEKCWTTYTRVHKNNFTSRLVSKTCRYVMWSSKMSQIQFSLFRLIVYIICKTTFHNWFQRYRQVKVCKTIGNKEIICFVWLYLKIIICEFPFILLITSHINIKYSGLNNCVHNGKVSKYIIYIYISPKLKLSMFCVLSQNY